MKSRFLAAALLLALAACSDDSGSTHNGSHNNDTDAGTDFGQESSRDLDLPDITADSGPDQDEPDAGDMACIPVSESTTMCVGDSLFYGDGCGGQESLIRTCAPGRCVVDACVNDPNGPLSFYGFEIRDGAPDRIYFSSTVPFSADGFTGFAIPNDSTSNTPSNNPHYSIGLSAITANGDDTEDHFFTVDRDYIYGDNVLIQYDGSNSIVSPVGAALTDFSHRHVANLLAEPTYSGAVYYVATDGDDDNNDGLSEGNAWASIGHAASIAVGGDIVHIKAGAYGNERVVFANSGTANNRIKFEGYTNSPGDNPNLNWEYGVQGLDAAVMPLLQGTNRDAGVALNVFNNENSFITLKNLQVRGYVTAVRGQNNHYLRLENIIASGLGKTGYSGHGITLIGITYNTTINDCVIENATATGYRVYGFFNAITDSKAYCDEFEGDAGGTEEPMDYYTTLRGDWNYISGVHLERVGDLEHGGHGITLKGDIDLGNEIGSVANNLAENSTTVHLSGSVEFRHRMVRFNTARNITILANSAFANGRTGGFDFRDGTSNNRVEGSTVVGVKNGISYFDTGEDQGAQGMASDNYVVNSVFRDITQSIVRMDSYRTATDDMARNKIMYCTFVDSPTLFAGFPQGDLLGNVFVGNIVNRVASAGSGAAVFRQTYSNYFGGFSAPADTGNNSVNPLFEDANGLDFRLSAASPCLDVGISHDAVQRDFDGVVRPQGDGFDQGAFERPVAASN